MSRPITINLFGGLAGGQMVQLTAFLEKIMASQAELAQALTDLGTQLDKTQGEIVAEVSKLEDAINAGGATSPEVDAALASLKAKVQSLDDLNPDAVVADPNAPTA